MRLEFDALLSCFAFNFNLRRYVAETENSLRAKEVEAAAAPKAGASTRPLLSCTLAVFVTATRNLPNISREKCFR